MSVMILANGLASDFVNVRFLLTIPGILFFIALIIWALACPACAPSLPTRRPDRRKLATAVVQTAASVGAAATSMVTSIIAARAAPQHHIERAPSGD